MTVSADVFEQIVKNNRMAVVYTDLNGIIQYTNEANDRLFAFDAGELNGKELAVLNADPQFTASKIIEITDKTGGWSGTILMRKKNASVFFGQLNVWKIKNAGGQSIGYGSNCTDVSEQKKAEKELQGEKAKLTAIINSTNDDVLSIDTNFNLVAFNDALAEKVRIGYGFELKAGISVFSFLPPGSAERLKLIYERALKGEKILLLDEFVSSKGDKMYHETSYHPIKTGEKITGVAIFSRNTTERRNKEKLLEASLKERELLLAEVHHRVKNNLAIVSGFLQLEEFNTVSPEVKELLKDSKARIKTTALVHELLYKNESLNRIDLISYIKDLLRLISDSYSSATIKIDVVTDFIEKK
jgi:PAS domain S-box-containing protein